MRIINLTINAIRQIQGTEHFKTLNDFIPEFQSKLTQQLRDMDLFPDSTILEALVQKTNPDQCGFKLIPGLGIHKLGDASKENTNENNFVFYAFNFGRNPERVKDNFYTIHQMFERQDFKTGILINIGNYADTYLWSYGSNFRDRIHELSIGYNGHANIQHTYFTEKGIISKKV
jgi:hypothetical protein